MSQHDLYAALLTLGEQHRFRVGLGEDNRANPYLPPYVALYSNEKGQWQVTFAGGSEGVDYTVDELWTTPEKLLKDLQSLAFDARDAIPGVKMLHHETVVDLTTVEAGCVLCVYCKAYTPRQSTWIHYNGRCDFYLCGECSDLEDEDDPIPALLLRDGEFMPTGERDAALERGRKKREKAGERERRRKAEVEADDQAHAFTDRQHPTAPFLQVLEGGIHACEE